MIAVERIRDISVKTTQLTEEVADSLEVQVDGIRDAAQRIDHLSAVSAEMGQEMTKFKL